MDKDIADKILSAVDANFDKQTTFLSELVSHPSTRGQEQAAQGFMAKALLARGMLVDRWQINLDDIRHLPGFSPVIGSYDDAVNVGRHAQKPDVNGPFPDPQRSYRCCPGWSAGYVGRAPLLAQSGRRLDVWSRRR